MSDEAVQAVARVIMGGGEPCEGSVDDAEKVLRFLRLHPEHLGFTWEHRGVEYRHTNPGLPRGRHNGVLWAAKRIVGPWIPDEDAP